MELDNLSDDERGTLWEYYLIAGEELKALYSNDKPTNKYYNKEANNQIFDIIYYRLKYAHLLEEFTIKRLGTTKYKLDFYLETHELKPLLEKLFAQRPVDFFYLYEHLYNKKGDK